MADGYARVSHKVGVVTGQNGPAAALLVSGLAEALKASVPIVALVQDVRARRRTGMRFRISIIRISSAPAANGCAA